MTAEKVNDNSRTSFFGRRFFSKINENRKALIVHSVLELLGLPVISLIAIITIYYEKNYLIYDYEVPEMFLAVATISLVISIFLGAFFALSTFSYLYRKSLADMNYSLPLNSKQRFFADYLAGLTVYFVPVICAVILSFIIIGTGSLFVDISPLTKMIPELVKAGFIVLFGMLLFYTLSVLAIIFCGSIFEAILSVFVINGIIPATIACVNVIVCSADGYGLMPEKIVEKLVFIATSPIGAIVFLANYMDNGFYDSTDGFISSLYIKWIIAVIIVSAVLLLAAYLLYKHRKAEDISKPYVYKGYFYVMMGAAVFCILSLFLAAEINVFAGILICAIGWFIMEVIRRRGFKRFWTAALGFAAAVAVTFLVKGVCDSTDGFGVCRYVPSESGIEAVTLSISGRGLLDYNSVTFKDKDVIKAVTALQKEAIDRHENYDSYEYNIIENNFDGRYGYEVKHDQTTVHMEYMLKSGSTVSRYYNIYSGMAGDLFKSILLSDEFAEYRTDFLAYSIIDIYYYYEGGRYGWEKLSEFENGCEFSIVKYDGLGDTKLRLNAADTRTFFEGYEKDMKNMTEADLERGKIYCYISGKRYIWVLDSFENTISFLEEHGYNAPETVLDSSGGITAIPFKIYSPVMYTYAPWYFFESYRNGYPWDMHQDTVALADSITSVDTYDMYYNNISRIDISNIDADTEEFFSRLTPMVFSEMPLAEVIVGDMYMYLPDENDNAELLERVMDNLENLWLAPPEDEYYNYYPKDYDLKLTESVEVESYQ